MAKNMWMKVVQRGILLRDAADATEVLLLRNPNGTWELPGGKIEYRETAIRSLEREIYEETGLTVTDAEPVEASVRTLTQKKKRGKFGVVYRCAFEGDGESVEISDEHTDFAWMDHERVVEANLKQVDEYRSLRRVLDESRAETGRTRPPIRVASLDGERSTNGDDTGR